MILKEEILELLERDREFRYAVAGLLGLEEILRRLDRHEEQLIKLREDMNAGFKRYDEEIVKLREDMNKLREDMNAGFRRHDEEIAKLREDMNRGFMLIEGRISALGTRWGMLSEEAFREGLRGVLESELGLRVERWISFDEEGIVFGYPSQIDIDVAIHDEKIILIEVKSHVDTSDISAFRRKIDFYIKKTGKQPARKLMVTPYADERALEAARKLSVEVYPKILWR